MIAYKCTRSVKIVLLCNYTLLPGTENVLETFLEAIL
jgi:hypothetical protein